LQESVSPEIYAHTLPNLAITIKTCKEQYILWLNEAAEMQSKSKKTYTLSLWLSNCGIDGLNGVIGLLKTTQPKLRM